MTSSLHPAPPALVLLAHREVTLGALRPGALRGRLANLHALRPDGLDLMRVQEHLATHALDVPAQEAAGLPRAGWHALRRSYALMLHERGVRPLDARDLMGHSSIAMTADTYQREGTPEALLERLERGVEG